MLLIMEVLHGFFKTLLGSRMQKELWYVIVSIWFLQIITMKFDFVIGIETGLCCVCLSYVAAMNDQGMCG